MLYILLQTPGGKGVSDLFPLIIIMVIFFFFMIWPQMRRQKKAKNFNESLQKGDHVVTSGGVHGKIISVADKFYTIELEEGKMKIEKTGISMEMTQASYPSESKDSK